MRKLRALWMRLRGMFDGARADEHFSAELENHLQMHIEDNLRSGMAPEQARRHALIKLGGMEQTKQAYRERSILPKLENFLRDSRFALRQLRKSPGFSITAILILTLGIGANTVVFSVLNAVLLRPLVLSTADRLVRVYSIKDGKQIGPSPLDVRDFAAQSHTLEKLAVYDPVAKECHYLESRRQS